MRTRHPSVKVSKAHRGKALGKLRQPRGASASQTFGLPCSDVSLRTVFMSHTASVSLVLCEASGTAAVGWASRPHDMQLVCVGGWSWQHTGARFHAVINMESTHAADHAHIVRRAPSSTCVRGW